MTNIKEILKKEKLLPLYTTSDMKSVSIAEEVLVKNNISTIEVTYRSDYANETIKQLADSGKLIVGAGTVRTVKQAYDAVQNGAQFIVTPGINEDVLQFCTELGIPIFPGISTPYEIQVGLKYGLDTFKFFPANIYGGPKGIKALSGPYYDLDFIPTGGVNLDNVNEYLNNDSVLAAGGSFIIKEGTVLEDEGKSADENLKEIMKTIQ